MESLSVKKHKEPILIIRVCHCCGKVVEGPSEPERCIHCKKSFLPLNYFDKIHAKNSKEYKEMFLLAEDLHSDDLIKGLTALW